MVDVTRNNNSGISNGLASLCHDQSIPSAIVHLLTSYPEWCPRYDEFQRRYANSLCIARQGRVLSPEQFTTELMEITGSVQLSQSAKHQHVELWREAATRNPGISGSPQEWLDVLADFIETCFPRSFDEWLNLADHAFETEGPRDLIHAINELVIHNMQLSIRTGYVALNIEEIASRNPREGFAHIMTWLQRFLALTELAWPTPAEVDNFAALNQFSLSGGSESHRAALAIMLQSHNAYSGLLDQRSRRENPFAFVVRSSLASPLNGSMLQAEIDSFGELTGLRAIELDALRTDDTSRSHGGRVTDRDRQEVLAAIERLKSIFPGSTPTTAALRDALKGRSVGHGKLKIILDERRANGEYDIPSRVVHKKPRVKN